FGGGYLMVTSSPTVTMVGTLHTHSGVNSGYTSPTVGAASITLNDAVMDPPHRTMAYIMCTPTSPVEDEVVRLFVSGSPVGPNKALEGVWGTNETVAYTWTAD